MAVYDLEEQDKLEDLKAWWKQWGNTIAGAVIAVCVGVIGVQGWRWWSIEQAERASVLYSAVSAAVRANDVAKAKDAMAQLADKYGRTGYAPRAALLVARLLFQSGDKAGAKAQLTAVIDGDADDEIKEIARLRLAAVLFDEKKYDDALRTLDAKHDDAFAAVYADLRGDILAAAGRREDARAAYQAALARLDARSPYRSYVQVKLDSLGGAAAGAAPAPAASAPAAATAAATAPAARPPPRPSRRSDPGAPPSMRRFDRATPICGVSRTDRSTDQRPMTRRPARPIGVRYAAAIVALLALPGCSSLSTWIPTIPAPSFDWFSSSKKLGPLPEFKAAANARIAWQVAVGKASPGLAPAATPGAIYAAATNGTIIRVDPATGATAWRIEAGMRLSAGVGADASLVAVGTDKGDVLAFTTDGKPLWQVKVTSEVVSPPRVADGVVVVRSGDGRVFGLAAADGKTRWVYLRNNPPLTVRNYAGGVITRGALFVGTAGGKLLALDLATGNIGWEGNVATPKGATELERIADVTSLPFVDEQQACAVAFQGRVACFEILRGTLNWSRELSSLEGIVGDSRYIYVTDDRGAVHALDRTTGASVWKQDKLAQRRPGGPQLLGDYLTVIDGEGYGYLLDRADGSLVGRVATDGTPPTAQPVRSGGTAVWQSTGGTLVSVGAS